MLLGALLAGLAINGALVGAVHALSHALGARHDLPHGVCNGLFLPPWCAEFNLPAAQERYALVASAFDGRREPGALPARLRELRPTGRAARGAGRGWASPRDSFEAIAERAMADLCMTTNPRPMSHADVIRICEALVVRRPDDALGPARGARHDRAPSAPPTRCRSPRRSDSDPPCASATAW